MIDYDANGNQKEIREQVSDPEQPLGYREVALRENLWDEEDLLRAVDLNPEAPADKPQIASYIYSADGERTVRYLPGRLDAYYSAKDAGSADRLEALLYPNALVTVKTLPLPEGLAMDEIDRIPLTKYTKHYYIGSERVASALGTVNDLGLLCEQSDFPDATIIERMNDKVDEAGTNLTEDYATFEKNLVLQEPFHYGTGMQLICDGNHDPELYAAYWYHPDHLGSSSYITNLDGEINQHMEYLPFGETLVEEHLNSYNSPFKFNAKELDAETGNYYYSARYYTPKYNLMLSVDPMYDLYPSFSPYAYTLQNPVKYIDPTGMAVESPDHEYRIEKNGEVTLINPTNDDFDVLYDHDMTRGMILDKGIMEGIEKTSFKRKERLESGEEKIIDQSVQLIDISGISEDKGQSLFEFLAQSSNSEFSHQKFKNKKRFIGTSYEDNVDYSASLTIHRNGEMTDHDHSHWEYILSPSPGDINAAKFLNQKGWNTRLRLYSPLTNEYESYNMNSPSINLQPVIIKSKK